MAGQDWRPDLDKFTPTQWEQLGISREDLEKRLDQIDERDKASPDVGQTASGFTIKQLSSDGKLTEDLVSLSDLKGKPTALIFGSYT